MDSVLGVHVPSREECIVEIERGSSSFILSFFPFLPHFFSSSPSATLHDRFSEEEEEERKNQGERERERDTEKKRRIRLYIIHLTVFV